MLQAITNFGSALSNRGSTQTMSLAACGARVVHVAIRESVAAGDGVWGVNAGAAGREEIIETVVSNEMHRWLKSPRRTSVCRWPSRRAPSPAAMLSSSLKMKFVSDEFEFGCCIHFRAPKAGVIYDLDATDKMQNDADWSRTQNRAHSLRRRESVAQSEYESQNQSSSYQHPAHHVALRAQFEVAAFPQTCGLHGAFPLVLSPPQYSFR